MSNPYAPPKSGATAENSPQLDSINLNQEELASLGSRLLGSIVDGLITGLPVYFILPKLFTKFDSLTIIENITIYEIIYSLVIYLFFLLVNFSLFRKGQTIGKLILKTQVRTLSGEIPSISNQIFLRYLFPTILVSIPIVGSLLNLLNALFIFGAERRCLHDRIAGTIVIKKR